jgi:hypothetical protein
MKSLIITNGDSTAAVLRAAGYKADILPWQDVLHDGPVPRASKDHAHDLECLSGSRAAFLADAFGEREEELRQRFVERDRVLRQHSAYDEVTLWFEHDLYDQLQLLQLLSFFHRERRMGSLRLVQADDYLGHQTTQSITRFDSQRTTVSSKQLRLAKEVFCAFRQSTPKRLAIFLKDDLSPLPYLKLALSRLFEELPSVVDGLSRTQRQALRLIQQNDLSPRLLFRRNQAIEEAMFMGDCSFWRCLEELVFNRNPLAQGLTFRFVEAADKHRRQCYLNTKLTLTATGERVLAGQADHAELNIIDRWLGGTHIVGPTIWRWDADSEHLIMPR